MDSVPAVHIMKIVSKNVDHDTSGRNVLKRIERKGVIEYITEQWALYTVTLVLAVTAVRLGMDSVLFANSTVSEADLACVARWLPAASAVFVPANSFDARVEHASPSRPLAPV